MISNTNKVIVLIIERFFYFVLIGTYLIII